MTCCPPPEHAEQKSGEERSVYEGEDELEHVHDIVEVGDEIGRGDEIATPPVVAMRPIQSKEVSLAFGRR